MKNLVFTAFIFSVLIAGCHRKVASAHDENAMKAEEPEVKEMTVKPADKPARDEEMSTMEGPTNTLVTAQIVAIKPLEEFKTAEGACAKNPCQASGVLKKIIRFGSSFHGQYQEGDTLLFHFDFTTQPTKDIFPELTQHLPGLVVGDVFEAELLERPDVDVYRVQMYSLTEHK